MIQGSIQEMRGSSSESKAESESKTEGNRAMSAGNGIESEQIVSKEGSQGSSQTLIDIKKKGENESEKVNEKVLNTVESQESSPKEHHKERKEHIGENTVGGEELYVYTGGTIKSRGDKNNKNHEDHSDDESDELNGDDGDPSFEGRDSFGNTLRNNSESIRNNRKPSSYGGYENSRKNSEYGDNGGKGDYDGSRKSSSVGGGRSDVSNTPIPSVPSSSAPSRRATSDKLFDSNASLSLLSAAQGNSAHLLYTLLKTQLKKDRNRLIVQKQLQEQLLTESRNYLERLEMISEKEGRVLPKISEGDSLQTKEHSSERLKNPEEHSSELLKNALECSTEHSSDYLDEIVPLPDYDDHPFLYYLNSANESGNSALMYICMNENENAALDMLNVLLLAGDPMTISDISYFDTEISTIINVNSSSSRRASSAAPPSHLSHSPNSSQKNDENNTKNDESLTENLKKQTNPYSASMINFGQQNAVGDTALIIASRQNSFILTEVLIARGALLTDVNYDGFDPETAASDIPLQDYLKDERTKQIELLYDWEVVTEGWKAVKLIRAYQSRGRDIEHLHDKFLSILHPECLTLKLIGLHTLEPKPVRSPPNISPLDLAISIGRTDILDCVVRAGADLMLRDQRGRTMLMTVCMMTRLPSYPVTQKSLVKEEMREGLIRSLLRSPVSTMNEQYAAVDKDGFNILSLCVELEYDNVVALLLSILNSKEFANNDHTIDQTDQNNEEDEMKINQSNDDINKVGGHRNSISSVKNALYSLFSTESKDNKDNKEKEVIETKEEKEIREINTLIGESSTNHNYADMRIVSKYTYRGVPGHRELFCDTPLILAGRRKNLAIITLLVEQGGCDVNRSGSEGLTPLMWAALRNDTDALQFLLSKGADINAQSDTGATALIWCCEKVHFECATLLLNYGHTWGQIRGIIATEVDTNKCTKTGFSPLIALCRLAAERRMSSYETENGSNGSDGNNSGKDPDNTDRLKREDSLLIQKSPLSPLQPSIPKNVPPPIIPIVPNNKFKNIPMKSNNAATIALEIEAKINRNNRSISTPIDVIQLYDAVALLIRRGADVNERTLDGYTPLYWAVANKNISLIRQLLSAGADPHRKDECGRSLIESARSDLLRTEVAALSSV